jgi:molybdopterin synthase catalytic subunit
MVKTSIQATPIRISEFSSCDDVGAELIFYGRVREDENGVTISGLEYEQYEDMAAIQLQSLAVEAAKRFRLKSLYCVHRIGYIPVGEVSLYIHIFSKHRKASIKAMEWFIAEIKKEVPIWKWGVKPDGSKFPSKAK